MKLTRFSFVLKFVIQLGIIRTKEIDDYTVYIFYNEIDILSNEVSES